MISKKKYYFIKNVHLLLEHTNVDLVNQQLSYQIYIHSNSYTYPRIFKYNTKFKL
jgi:hypothetical protein